MARAVICSLLMVAVVALGSCGGDSTASGTVASEVCVDLDSEKGVRAAAHDVVHMVEDKLADG